MPEIQGFEDFVVNFMHEHEDIYVLLIVDENLNAYDASSGHESISISGSQCIVNIRKRLPAELERRILALVRSANDSARHLALYNRRAHGFLGKLPMRSEKVNEILAPLWLKRFPPSEFADALGHFVVHDASPTASEEELASTPSDISRKLVGIDNLFTSASQVKGTNIIRDHLHELKGDLLTLNWDLLTLHSDSSMISILGMINVLLSDHEQTSESINDVKWNALRDRIRGVVGSPQNSLDGSEMRRTSKTGMRFKRGSMLFVGHKNTPEASPPDPGSKNPLAASAGSTCSSKISEDSDNPR
jgi:hypothetical protein